MKIVQSTFARLFRGILLFWRFPAKISVLTANFYKCIVIRIGISFYNYNSYDDFLIIIFSVLLYTLLLYFILLWPF